MSPLGWLLQPAVLPWAALAFGLCIGSFLNVVIHRLPKMMEREWRAECAALAGEEPSKEERYNLVVPRSRCPGCGHAITALENIPLARLGQVSGRYAQRRGSARAARHAICLRRPNLRAGRRFQEDGSRGTGARTGNQETSEYGCEDAAAQGPSRKRSAQM